MSMRSRLNALVEEPARIAIPIANPLVAQNQRYLTFKALLGRGAVD